MYIPSNAEIGTFLENYGNTTAADAFAPDVTRTCLHIGVGNAMAVTPHKRHGARCLKSTPSRLLVRQLTAYSSYRQGKNHWPFWEGNPPVTSGSPSQKVSNVEPFPRHEIIMKARCEDHKSRPHNWQGTPVSVKCYILILKTQKLWPQTSC